MSKNRFSARLAAVIARLMPNHKEMMSLDMAGPLATLGVDALGAAQNARINQAHYRNAPFGSSSNSVKRQARGDAKRKAVKRARKLGHA